jgi:hypothetical protein
MADFGWIKEHPYEAGGVILGGGIILYLIFTSGSSGSSASTATPSTVAAGGPTYAAQPDDTALSINAQLTAAQLSAATQGQLSTDAVTLGSLQSNNQTQVQLAQASDALQAVQSDNATQLGLYTGYFQSALQMAQAQNNTPASVPSVNPGNPYTVSATPLLGAPPQISVANPVPPAWVGPAGSQTAYQLPFSGSPPISTSQLMKATGSTSAVSYTPTTQTGVYVAEVPINAQNLSEGYTDAAVFA